MRILPIVLFIILLAIPAGAGSRTDASKEFHDKVNELKESLTSFEIERNSDISRLDSKQRSMEAALASYRTVLAEERVPAFVQAFRGMAAYLASYREHLELIISGCNSATSKIEEMYALKRAAMPAMGTSRLSDPEFRREQDTLVKMLAAQALRNEKAEARDHIARVVAYVRQGPPDHEAPLVVESLNRLEMKLRGSANSAAQSLERAVQIQQAVDDIMAKAILLGPDWITEEDAFYHAFHSETEAGTPSQEYIPISHPEAGPVPARMPGDAAAAE